MEVIRFYKKHIVENKNFVLISIVLACLIRMYFHYTSNGVSDIGGIDGYFWTTEIKQYFARGWVSLGLSFLFSISIALYAAVLNTKHKLIRSRTYLIFSISILLLSCHPVFIYMNAQYIALLLTLACIDILFSSYQKTNSASNSYIIGFTLSFASLFSFSVLMYLPVFWIGLRIMRSFGFRTFITSIFGASTIYWIVFFFFLWQNNSEAFTYPFEQLYPIFSSFATPINNIEIAMLAMSVLLLIIITINYSTNFYLDKIQVRAYLVFVFTIAIFSFLALFFVVYDQILYLYILIVSGSVLISHFFALAERKWKTYLFYFFISLYFIICIYFFN